MTDVRVERARMEQVQPLAAAYRREAAEQRNLVDPPLPKDALFWVATCDGTPVGYAAGTRRPEGLVLGPVYVVPEQRRSGVGVRLLSEIERWAGDVGIVEVSVASDNEAGVRFLESAGYRPRRILMARDTEPTGART